VATPGEFHNYVYHWQYSLDAQLTWNDVPEKVLGGHNITNTEVSRFAIYDLLGEDHKNHFGSIYFRIGYNQDRMLSTNTIKINYSPCAPVVTDVVLENPKCNGGGIQKLEVTFDRALDAAKNENLYQLYLQETTNNTGIIKTTPMFQVSNVAYPDNTKIYSYSNISSFTSLENGREYEVIYQAQVKHPTDPNPTIKILKGTMVSAKKIRYIDPAPLKFEIKEANNPLCANDLAEVSIAVTGGTGNYKFFVDGIEKDPVPVKEADTFYHIRGLIPTATNDIKVMDTNDCIEKTP
jgi:hypothetical protein